PSLSRSITVLELQVCHNIVLKRKRIPYNPKNNIGFEIFISTDNPGFRPSRRERIGSSDRCYSLSIYRHWGIDRIGSIRPLGIIQVFDPFLVESSNISIEDRRTHIHLGVSSPAQSFITLWAVGRDIEIISLLRPKYIAI